jgi:hypothetical protein
MVRYRPGRGIGAELMHTVCVDLVRKLIEVKLVGFFAAEQVAPVAVAVREAIRSLGAAAGQHSTLYDVSEADISPGPTIAAITAAFADPAFHAVRARRVAFVSPSALARLQIQRLRDGREDIAIFADRESALAWLLDKPVR